MQRFSVCHSVTVHVDKTPENMTNLYIWEAMHCHYFSLNQLYSISKQMAHCNFFTCFLSSLCLYSLFFGCHVDLELTVSRVIFSKEKRREKSENECRHYVYFHILIVFFFFMAFHVDVLVQSQHVCGFQENQICTSHDNIVKWQCETTSTLLVSYGEKCN